MAVMDLLEKGNKMKNLRLERNSLFWSRLGFENDPARFDDTGKLIEFSDNYAKYARYHADMYRLGIKLHTSILFSGWVGNNQYDYTLTDRTLDTLFAALPEDALYIPRVKLNAPVEWSKHHPEELFVYYGGNNDPEYIRPRVGSLEHDLLGYEAPNGYYMGKDQRPNVNGFFSNQSFASKVWKHDAAEALRRLMHHVAEKPYGRRIIGWHIAYGVSGETCLWGRFGREYGDYSRVFQEAFIAWGEKKYDSRENLLKAWGTLKMPPPDRRRKVYDSVEAFQRKRPCDRIVRDLDEFMSELNSYNAEYFCRIVKEEAPEALTGLFYGYVLECCNSAYTGWLGFEKILNSPYVDFLAAPTSYTCRQAGESGGFIVPAQSVGLRKQWVDELDIRTYLAQPTTENRIPKECTRAVFYRELTKNLSADAGYWWMDLGGGWFDSEFIHDIIQEIESTAAKIRCREHVSTADVLFLIDERSQILHTESPELFGLHKIFRREAALAGVQIDLYRISDLSRISLEQYKLIVLCDCPEMPSLSMDKTVLYMYLDALPEGLAVQEVRGQHFPAGDIAFQDLMSGKVTLENWTLPRVAPEVTAGMRVHARLADGTPAVVSNGNRFYSVLPILGWKQFRELAEFAGCRLYGEAPCVVYGDSRFTAVFSHDYPEKFRLQIQD